jgi:hypothetical protein
MKHDLAQRGEGRAGCIFWLAVLLITGLIGFKVVPVKYRNSQIYDFMYEQAKYAQQARPDRIRKDILRRARELKIPLDPKKLVVKRQGGRIFLQMEYDEVINFPGYTYTWHFKEVVDEPVFIW